MSSETETQRSLKIIYGGDSHEIDAEVLIESLVSYSVVIQEASAYLSPESKVNIKIKAHQEGSFELLLNIIADGGGGLFDKDTVEYAGSLVAIVGGLYELNKFLSKSESDAADTQEISVENIDESVIVKTNQGQITVNKNVYHIYQSSDKAKEGLRNTFVKLKDAEEIESFDIIDEDRNESVFHAEKEDFAVMSSEKIETNRRTQREVRTGQSLSVFKVVFKENHKWEFFYNGVRIYASISDEDFSGKVTKGEVAFRSGDRMVADMEIVQVFNEAANTFVNDQYIITKVLQHIPRTTNIQESINFN